MWWEHVVLRILFPKMRSFVRLFLQSAYPSVKEMDTCLIYSLLKVRQQYFRTVQVSMKYLKHAIHFRLPVADENYLFYFRLGGTSSHVILNRHPM